MNAHANHLKLRKNVIYIFSMLKKKEEKIISMRTQLQLFAVFYTV